MDILDNQNTPEKVVNDAIPSRRIKKASKLAIFGTIGLNLLTIGAGAVGIGIAAWKYQSGSDFSNSYNVRFELDDKDENPWSDDGCFNGQKLINSTDEFQRMLNSTANEYSQYLHNKGISNFNVYPEFVKDKDAPNDFTKAHAYINVNLPNKTFKHDDKVESYDPSQIYMDDISSSRISIVLDMHDLKETTNTSVLSVIPLDDNWIDYDNTKTNPSNPKQVDIKLKHNLSDIVNSYYKQVTDSNSATLGDDASIPSAIYVVRDFNGLLNRMVYTDQIQFAVDSNKRHDIDNKFFNKQTLLDYGYGSSNKDGCNDFYTAANKASGGEQADNTSFGIKWEKDDASSSGEALYFNYNIDNLNQPRGSGDKPLNNTGTIAPYFFGNRDGAPGTASDTPAYAFMSDYILAIGKASSDTDTASSSYLNVLPNTSPTDKNANKDEYNWLTINANTRYTANNVVAGLKHFAFDLPQKVVNIHLDSTNNALSGGLLFGNTAEYGKLSDKESVYGIYNQMQKARSNLSNSGIFKSKALLSILIAVIIIIIMIGTIVSVLYRVPGAFGCFSLFATFSLTIMIMALTGFVLTLPMFIGLLIGLVAGTFVIFAVCERIKKQVKTVITFDAAVKKGMKRSILPLIDIHVILIVLGMCLSFIGFNELTAVGNTLLIFGLISIVFMGPVYFGTIFVCVINGYNRLKTNLMFSDRLKPIKTNNMINGKQYETTINGSFELRHFNIFGLKQIIILSVLAAIILLGVILLFTVGVHSSYMFYGGTRIAIVVPSDKPMVKPVWLPSGYANIVYDNIAHTIFVYYSKTINFDAAWGMAYGDNVFVQHISSGAEAAYLKTTTIILSVTSAVLAVYAFVRLNWISMIPTFIASFAAPGLMLAIIGICQVYFDLYIALAVVIVYVFNMFIIFTFTSNIYNQWTKRQVFNRHDLKTIFNLEIKNDLPTYAWLFGITIASVLIFAVVGSTSLLWMMLATILGIVATAGTSIMVLPFFQYWFMLLRYKYLGSASLGENIIVRKNYDDVDEQLIIGLNKFIRQKPTL